MQHPTRIRVCCMFHVQPFLTVSLVSIESCIGIQSSCLKSRSPGVFTRQGAPKSWQSRDCCVQAVKEVLRFLNQRSQEFNVSAARRPQRAQNYATLPCFMHTPYPGFRPGFLFFTRKLTRKSSTLRPRLRGSWGMGGRDGNPKDFDRLAVHGLEMCRRGPTMGPISSLKP